MLQDQNYFFLLSAAGFLSLSLLLLVILSLSASSSSLSSVENVVRIGMKIALLVVQYVYRIVQVSVTVMLFIHMFYLTQLFFQGILYDVHVINWASELHWIADSSNQKPEFFVCLQSWIRFYQWKNINTALASLSQLMSSKKNLSVLEEIAERKQYMFIKKKLIHMLHFYKKRNY